MEKQKLLSCRITTKWNLSQEKLLKLFLFSSVFFLFFFLKIKSNQVWLSLEWQQDMLASSRHKNKTDPPTPFPQPELSSVPVPKKEHHNGSHRVVKVIRQKLLSSRIILSWKNLGQEKRLNLFVIQPCFIFLQVRRKFCRFASWQNNKPSCNGDY